MFGGNLSDLIYVKLMNTVTLLTIIVAKITKE
jgi:hypothetical protein